MEIMNWADCSPIPWKNGGGSVRLVASHPPQAGVDDFDWRISVAEITADGPFSDFPDVDRCFVLLRGAGVLLTPDSGAPWELTEVSQLIHFEGELRVDATLVAGPVQNLSVLARRSRCCSSVVWVNGVYEQHFDAGPATVVLCLDGEVVVTPIGGHSISLQGGQALICRIFSPPWVLISANPLTRLVIVRLNSLPSTPSCGAPF